MNKRKICVVTGSRAEYGLFYPILIKIQESNKLKLQLISTSSHHSTDYFLPQKPFRLNHLLNAVQNELINTIKFIGK